MIAGLFPETPLAALPNGWLVDTLIATSLLCLLVLAIRRSVAQHFGPHIAYALWLIPALRMILPPLPQVYTLSSPFTAAPSSAAAVIIDAPIAAMAPTMGESALALAIAWLPMLLLGIWFAGALAMLGWQALVHRRLAGALAHAELVEIIGNVRVYRSDAVGGPLSFGLLEPVIMLPADERLALSPAERALAIDHELTHHARGDLWANGAAVLFAALHWFNPLMRGAWRAFRFDQEAACDASVLALSDGAQRGTYARALAKTATGHPSAFASPMIGPDRLKERLAMLTRPTVSPLRRRIGALLAATVLVGAMVATATPVLADHPEPPAPPAAPAAPEAPQPPAPPAPVTIDGARSIDISNDNGAHVTRIRRDDGTTIVLRTGRALNQAEIERMVAEAEASRAEAEREWGTAEEARGEAEAARGEAERQRTRIIIRERSKARDASDAAGNDDMTVEISAAERRVMERAIHRAIARAAANAERASERAEVAAHDAARVRIRHAAVTRDCADGASSDILIETGPDAMAAEGARKSYRYLVCNGDGSLELQLSAMRQARATFAALERSPHLPEAARVEALAELDAEIASVERQLAERNN